MADMKNRYSDLRWEQSLKPKSWIYKKYDTLAWEAYNDDLKPYDEVELTGEFIGKFNKAEFMEKQSFSNGRYYDNIPVREKVTRERVYDEYDYEVQRQLNAQDKGPISNIEVPNDVYNKWAHLNPQDYISDYNNRKNIIDAYLNNFDEEKRLRLKQTMSNSYDGQGYVLFLDTDYATMNEKQKLIYEDIIKFYEEVYLADLRTEQEILEQIKQSKEVYQQNEMNEISKNREDNISEEFNPIDQKDLLNQTINQTSTQNTEHEELVFKPQTKIVEQSNLQKSEVDYAVREPVIVDEEYMKNYRTIPSTHFKNLFNVPQCYNVADLIAARKEVEVRNHELITEIVSDEISTNNLIVNNMNADQNNMNNQNMENQEIPVTNYR